MNSTRRPRTLAIIAGAFLTLTVTALSACSKSPTSPNAGAWIIDASPFPGYMLVADRLKLEVVVIDSVGLLHAASVVGTMTVSDSHILQFRGDTLVAMSMGRADVIISGDWQGLKLTTHRPIVVAPRPASPLVAASWTSLRIRATPI